MKRVVLLLLLTWAGHAAALTGTDLKSFCDDDKASLQLACLMYISGVAAGLNLTPVVPADDGSGARELICPPAGARHMARRQVVAAYLEAHPEVLTLPAEALVFLSLREAWPCSGGASD
jgi:hypothetical protein